MPDSVAKRLGYAIKLAQYEVRFRMDEAPHRYCQRTSPGARRFALATGEPVRAIDGRLYQVIGTGELIRRLD